MHCPIASSFVVHLYAAFLKGASTVSLFECLSVMQLDVSSSVHGQSQLSATISWSASRGSTDMPAKWQVSVKNLTWIQNDDWYREWLYDVDVGEYFAASPTPIAHIAHIHTRLFTQNVTHAL